MNVSVRWLRELVPALEADPREVARRLSMTAVAVDEVVPLGEELDGIVVARVVEARPHPGADRLTLCRVDPGAGEAVDVVCGAPDVVEGALYPYVPAGGRLPGGLEIESREIRGETSHGMLCSEKELGLGPDESGIMRLSGTLAPGDSLEEALGLPDARLVLDLTPNRVDLACHVGVARELAPPGAPELRLRDPGGPGWTPAWRDGEPSAEGAGVRVTLDDPERCPRYLGAVIRGLEVGPSPSWLAGRLRAVGARPVNNVVDATNYVLHELNQPLHAFDLDRLRGGEIRVRAARAGESLTTLDGEERALSPEMTVIADGEGPVALAGVMGGEASEVTGETRDVFLECAWFDPKATRHTAGAADLSTDASYRFERAIDPALQERALRRCVEIVLATAGGEADAEAVRAGGAPLEPSVVTLRPSRVEQVLGVSFPVEELWSLLRPLGFEPAEGEGPGEDGAVAIRVPGWRGDVTREVDLVEEVARRHGYESFPTERRAFRPSAVPHDPRWRRAARARELLAARGFLETRSSTLASRGAADQEAPVELLRPLAADQRYLRGAVVPVLLGGLEHNFARGVRNVRLYEIGTTFRKVADDGEAHEGGSAAGRREAGPEEARDELLRSYAEEIRVGALLTGRRRPEHWADEPAPVDAWDLKGLAEEAAGELCGADLEPGADEGTATRFSAGGWLGAERFHMVRGEETVGLAGRVRRDAVDAPPWAGPVYGLEFRLDAVETARRPRYEELSSFPPVHRDLAVTVPEDVPAGRVEAAIREAAPATLEQLRLFDVFRGESVEEGRRSLAYRFRFRAPDRTLEDREAEAAMEAVVQHLREACDARVRSG